MFQRSRVISLVAACLFCLLASSPAMAWNGTGHMTVALIAWRQLTPAQQQQITALLRQHPHYKQLLLRDLPAGVDEGEWAFVVAATWPDLIRPAFSGERAKPQSITQYHHPEWHYITVYDYNPEAGRRRGQRDESATSQPAAFTPPPSATQPIAEQIKVAPKPNALTAYQDAVAALADNSVSAEERAVALSWLEHLAGDIHQPLHDCSMISATYPQSDRGGNEQVAGYNDRPVKLHTFWDDLLGVGIDYPTISFLADRITATPANDPHRLPPETRDAPATTWVEESYAYAIAFAYGNNHLQTFPAADSRNATPDQIPPLPEAYEQNARALAEQRIALAGYRLAQQLNALFKPAP